MKYFRVNFVSQKTMHPSGLVCFEHYIAAETKAAAKVAALEFLRTEDANHCMYYKAPRLEEITAERYAEQCQKDVSESAASDIDLYLACLVIFGEQESYDEDELRDASDLLAMPEDEPALHGTYLLLKDDLDAVLSVRDIPLSAEDIRKEALSLYLLGKPSNEQEGEISTISADTSVDSEGQTSEQGVRAQDVSEQVKKETDLDVRSTIFWLQYPPVSGKVLGGGGLTVERVNDFLSDIKSGDSLVFTGLPNAVYHAADGYSSTQIRLALDGGLSALDWYKNAPRKAEESSALTIGTAVHTALLEPMRFAEEYVCAPAVNMRTTEGKETWAAFEAECANLGLTGLKRDEFDLVTLMRDSALAWPVVRELLSDGVAELSIFWRTPNGVLLKVRPDWLGRYAGVPFLLDIKTTDDVADFGKSVEKYGYHVQAAFYSYVVSKVFGLELDFAFCAISKRAECGRYPVRLTLPDDEDLQEGNQRVQEALAIVSGGDGVTGGLGTVSRPWWAKQADRKRREAAIRVGGAA